ncbi:hypothetical protein NDU88_000338 [Pleurodeles waltl]|uniref:Uncharacterized protein n=1 Tax=Pleurodeles waltl TaxID=8319 RepID=A0AAV7V6P9_PLEWA|nr:hypothetical protein NDU88_000338 [Pleurodeles waltl]
MSHGEGSDPLETSLLGGAGRGAGAPGRATGPPRCVGPEAIGGRTERGGAGPPLGGRGAVAGSAGTGAGAAKKQWGLEISGAAAQRKLEVAALDGGGGAGGVLGEGVPAPSCSGGILTGSPVVTGARVAAKRRSRTLEDAGARRDQLLPGGGSGGRHCGRGGPVEPKRSAPGHNSDPTGGKGRGP